MARSHFYSQDYQKIAFDTWYLNRRPDIQHLKELLPPDEYGKVPSTGQIRKWQTFGTWDIRADELDLKVTEKSDQFLISEKVKMLRVQQENASKLAEKALAQMLQDGFDSSSSAVQAYFRATEEMRKNAGFSDLLERLDKMTNRDVENQIVALLERASSNDQIVDAEDVQDADDTVSQE